MVHISEVVAEVFKKIILVNPGGHCQILELSPLIGRGLLGAQVSISTLFNNLHINLVSGIFGIFFV